METITPLQRDRSGRITRLALQEGKRTSYLSGNSFRLLAGPAQIKSAHFTVERNNQSFIFNGSGYGHGVGMSQWGACNMARQGYRAEQILQWYYPGTTSDSCGTKYASLLRISGALHRAFLNSRGKNLTMIADGKELCMMKRVFTWQVLVTRGCFFSGSKG